MNNAQLKESGFRSIKQLAAVWLAAVSALVVPLYMGNGYLELIEQKAKLYIFLALPALIIIAALEILEFVATLPGTDVPQKEKLIGNEEANKWVGNYYLTSSGVMATNTWIGNYYVDGTGKWVRSR